MKRQRRERSDLLFARGFQTGVDGRSMDLCPYQAVNLRQHWVAGWREGRVAFHQGLSGVGLLGTMR